MSKKIKLALFCALVLLTLNANAQASTCIYDEMPTIQHLRDAIHLNKTRKKLYQQYFGKNAAKIFAKVMVYERLMLPFAAILDLQAKPFLCAGISILKNDLVSIETTPTFSSVRNIPQDFVIPDDRKTVDRLKKQLSSNIQADRDSQDVHFTKTLETLKLTIHQLNLRPHVNCLQRHFLESAALALTHAANNNFKAKNLGLKSTIPLTIKYVKSHLKSLSIMSRLDRKAYPLQKEGIPIFCQDVPSILF